MSEIKKKFESKFNDLVKDHTIIYKGRHPIVIWNEKDKKPKIEHEFFYSLPQALQDAIQILLTEIEG